MREIKFRAYVPAINLMLDNITLYGSGMMGYDLDEFQSYIDGLPKHIQFIDDAIYHSDEDHFDLLLTVLPGEDWIWLEEGEFIPMQYTGLKDNKGKEYYEDDILKFEDNEGSVWFGKIVWYEYAWQVWTKEWGYELLSEYIANDELDFVYNIVSSIHENPELLNERNK